jgi:hypothetical protein
MSSNTGCHSDRGEIAQPIDGLVSVVEQSCGLNSFRSAGRQVRCIHREPLAGIF